MEKTALITGASRGLGAALAEALCETHHIIAVARTTGALEELDDRIKTKGGAATLAPMDICVPEAMQQLCFDIHSRWGGVDLWVHTAIHAAPLAPANHIDPKDWSKSMETNATATARLITYVSPLLEARNKANAIFFDDPRTSGKFFGAYGASKSAQMFIATTWQAETINSSITVKVHELEPMNTAVTARFFPGKTADDAASTPRVVASRIVSELAG